MRSVPLHLVAAAAILLGYVGWIAESRWRQQDHASPARTNLQRASAGIPAELIPNGPGVRIVNFYTGSREIDRGDHAVVCYSVLNASSLRLDPPVEDLKPSLNRCFAVTPERDTTYTLSALGADGSIASASFVVKVNPPPPRIEMLSISAKEIRRGQPFDMCYTVRNATALRLEPPAVPVTPDEKRCFHWYPVQTTKFRLVATGEGGRTDHLEWTLVVRTR